MMIRSRLWEEQRGTTAIEFALTAPAFFLVLFAAIEAGLLLWTQLGLQHGVEMAARCAGIDVSTCDSTSTIQGYAAQQSFGINPSPTTFTVSTASCGAQVTANYTFPLIVNVFGVSALALTAEACFPT